MSIEVTSSVEIARPAAAVFAYLADWTNNPAWQRGMVSCTTTSDGRIEVGATYHQVARMLGRTIESDFEVVAFEPDRMIRITTTAGTFPITVERRVEPRGQDACTASAHVQGDPGGMFRIAAPLLARMVQQSVRADYRRLREVLQDQ